MSKPTDAAMAAAKGLLRYLSATADLKLTFSGSDNHHLLSIYTDADFGACLDTRKSVSGFVIILNDGAIAWHSKKQSTVALSTTEAEYMASAAAVREVLWFRTLAIDLDLGVTEFIINADNQGMMNLARNPILSQRTKHVDIIYHFVRERVTRGDVMFRYVPTGQMLADVFTKALPKQKHLQCCAGLGLK